MCRARSRPGDGLGDAGAPPACDGLSAGAVGAVGAAGAAVSAASAVVEVAHVYHALSLARWPFDLGRRLPDLVL